MLGIAMTGLLLTFSVACAGVAGIVVAHRRAQAAADPRLVGGGDSDPARAGSVPSRGRRGADATAGGWSDAACGARS
jgi:hypothetical protein